MTISIYALKGKLNGKISLLRFFFVENTLKRTMKSLQISSYLTVKKIVAVKLSIPDCMWLEPQSGQLNQGTT